MAFARERDTVCPGQQLTQLEAEIVMCARQAGNDYDQASMKNRTIMQQPSA